MFIKFNYNDTIRKTKIEKLSIQSIRESFLKLYEGQFENIEDYELSYKDEEDNEFIQIYDQSDIESCLLDREDNDIKGALKIFIFKKIVSVDSVSDMSDTESEISYSDLESSIQGDISGKENFGQDNSHMSTNNSGPEVQQVLQQNANSQNNQQLHNLNLENIIGQQGPLGTHQDTLENLGQLFQNQVQIIHNMNWNQTLPAQNCGKINQRPQMTGRNFENGRQNLHNIVKNINGQFMDGVMGNHSTHQQNSNQRLHARAGLINHHRNSQRFRCGVSHMNRNKMRAMRRHNHHHSRSKSRKYGRRHHHKRRSQSRSRSGSPQKKQRRRERKNRISSIFKLFPNANKSQIKQIVKDDIRKGRGIEQSIKNCNKRWSQQVKA